MEAKRFGRILLPVDSSGESRRAAAAAIELAVLRGQARLFALNVIDKALVNRMKPFADNKVAELEIELEENGWKALREAPGARRGRAFDLGVTCPRVPPV